MIPSKKHLYIFASIFLIILLIPICIYIFNFKSFSVSDSTSLWGSFGDFIGGVLNPIISIASLIVLGYLTYLVGKQSTLENKKLFLLQQRLPAYQEVVKSIKEINMYPKKMQQINANLKHMETLPNVSGEMIMHEILKMQESLNVFGDFYYTLFTFNIKYGHLFDYDFSNNKFKSLIRETKDYYDSFNNLSLKITNKELIDSENDFKVDLLNEKYLNDLADLINELRDELK